MNTSYPTSLLEATEWAKSTGSDTATGRFRFAQYLVLCSVASVRELRNALVFKGGNALDFAWQPNRSTLDLDFTIDGGDFDEDSLSASLDLGLTAVSRQSGALLQLHSITQQPRGANRTRVTYKTIFGYALPDEFALRQRMERALRAVERSKPISARTIPSVLQHHSGWTNSANCASAPSKTSSLRNCVRCYSNWFVIGSDHRMFWTSPLRLNVIQINRADIASYLLTKSAERDIVVTRAAFFDPELSDRARLEYGPLRTTARNVFIPFDEAMAIVLDLVDSLPIPEE